MTRHVGFNKTRPYSRTLRRGVIGKDIDGRSEVGRYARDLETQLTEHCGGNPTITQKLLIECLIKTSLQLRALDEKLAGDNWTEHDSRTHGGLINRQRLLLREIGIKPAVASSPADRSFEDFSEFSERDVAG